MIYKTLFMPMLFQNVFISWNVKVVAFSYEFCYGVSELTERYLKVPKVFFKSSATVFLEYLRGTWRYLSFF
jgi:hypothetical protein